MLVVISQETFVPLKGGWAILWPRVALGMLDRPSKSENGDCPCPPKRRFLPKRVQSQSPQSPSPSPRPLVAGGPHLQTPHRRDKSSCELFDTTNNFFPELGRPNNNPKPPEQSALKILEEAGRRPHGFSASNIINAHIPDAKPAPTDFGTCGGTHQFTTPE